MPRKRSPLRMAIFATGETEADFSRHLGYTPGTGRQVIAGTVAAWPEFRQRASHYLGVDEEVLFGDDALAAAAAVLNARAGAREPIRNPETLAQVAAIVRAGGGAP